METEKVKIGVKEQEEIFSLIGRTIKKRVECYVVGGTAMMFLGLKEVTKDIDIVFREKEAYEEFKKTLLALGAKESEAKVINPEKVSSILTVGNARFDLFYDYLINFKLTENIIERVIESHGFSNLTIKVISPEDIILFKSFANREGDRIDVTNILKKVNINWDIILGEAQNQTRNSNYFFSVFLYDFIMELKEDFKIEVPKDFMKNLKKAAEKSLIKAEEKLKKKGKRKD